MLTTPALIKKKSKFASNKVLAKQQAKQVLLYEEIYVTSGICPTIYLYVYRHQ